MLMSLRGWRASVPSAVDPSQPFAWTRCCNPYEKELMGQASSIRLVPSALAVVTPISSRQFCVLHHEIAQPRPMHRPHIIRWIPTQFKGVVVYGLQQKTAEGLPGHPFFPLAAHVADITRLVAP